MVGIAKLTVTLFPLVTAMVQMLPSPKSPFEILASFICVPVPLVVNPELLKGKYALHLAPENSILGLLLVASTVPVIVA